MKGCKYGTPGERSNIENSCQESDMERSSKLKPAMLAFSLAFALSSQQMGKAPPRFKANATEHPDLPIP